MQHPATEPDASDASVHAKDGEAEKQLPIRERLRKWDAEHVAHTEAMLTDLAGMGQLSNTFTRPQNVTMAEFDVSPPLFDGDELGDLRTDDTVLKPGDLVELRYVRQSCLYELTPHC